MSAKILVIVVLLLAVAAHLQRRYNWPAWLVAFTRKAQSYNEAQRRFASDWRIWLLASLAVFIIILSCFRFHIKNTLVTFGPWLWDNLTGGIGEAADYLILLLYCAIALGVSGLLGWIMQCFIVMVLRRREQ